jgi:hypothetical protein
VREIDNEVFYKVSGSSNVVALNTPAIGIYQPFFNEAVRQYLDPGFIALDWLQNPDPPLRELALHRHILQSRLFERHELTGLFSPKFFSKTGLTSSDVKDWINQNPGHEVYCFDGRPYVSYAFYKAWSEVLVAIRPILKAGCGMFVPRSDLIFPLNWDVKPPNKRSIAIFGAPARASGSAGEGKSFSLFFSYRKAIRFWRARCFAKHRIALLPRSF